MKRIQLLVALLLVTGSVTFSQNTPYNVVFDLTTSDTATHQHVIRWIKSILAAHPDAKLEVVFYGKSLPMVEKGESTVNDDIQQLGKVKNVSFSVCEQAMKAHSVTKDMLLPGVNTVPDAIYEIISKQAAGYGYIKVTN